MAAEKINTHSNRELTVNPRWRLFVEGGHLFLSGGADEIYVVDEIPNLAAAERLLTASRKNNFRSLENDHELAAALRQLRRVGAIAAKVPADTPLRASLAWAGDALPLLSKALSRQVSASEDQATWTLDAADAQLVLLVRTNATWRDTIAAYEQNRPQVPHLFIDLAYRHTLGIGPYVVPGDTACIGCLGHRIAHQWGDAPLPAQPAVNVQHDVVAGLMLNALNDFATNGLCTEYVEHAVSLDLRTLSSRRDRVFRLPWCSVCGNSEIEGRLPLPWLAAKISN
jgi:bacteriocin biosynthesis cyclodehydratase domain-containing protein